MSTAPEECDFEVKVPAIKFAGVHAKQGSVVVS